MYPYHGCIKKRIMAGELVKWEFVKDYPNIGECLVLYFSTQPFVRPIRPHSYHRYVDSLAGTKNMLSKSKCANGGKVKC